MEYTVTFIRKRVRSLRLHVKENGEVICSVPFFCLNSTAQKFVQDKADWIEQALKKVQVRSESKLLLRQESVAVKCGFTNDDRVKGERQYSYSKQWKECAMEVFRFSVDKYLSMFEKGQLPDFEIKGRSMKTVWGTCNVRSKVITLNWELLNFTEECIDYVVLHEMCHFLDLRHDKKFYGEIEKKMPDYKRVIRLMK